MSDWRYVLFSMNGDGTETFVNGELPLDGATLSRVLSGPHTIDGDLNLPTKDLLDEQGNPLITRWKSTIYAEDPNGNLWIGAIVTDYSIDGPKMSITTSGHTTYGVGQPFEGEESLVGADPLDVVRLIWQRLQDAPGSNIGMVVDSATSPARIGTEASDDDTSQGPYQLNWWSTDDCQGEVVKLAQSTPFDYLEEHAWDLDGDGINHFLRLGYPAIGRRLEGPTAPRFVLGENVRKMPSEQLPSDDVVTHIIVLGAGEGRDRIRGEAAVTPTQSVWRTKIVDDKSIIDTATAITRAQQELARYQTVIPGAGITELVIMDHPSAQFGSYDVGDEIAYGGDHDWGEVDVWVKIVKLSVTPQASRDVIATVVRTDTIA